MTAPIIKLNLKDLILFSFLISFIGIATIQPLYSQNYFELPLKNQKFGGTFCTKDRNRYYKDFLNDYNNYNNRTCGYTNNHVGKDIEGFDGQSVLACGDGEVVVGQE